MFHDFINLFYPRICNCCDLELTRNEDVVCTSCLHALPTTNYHHYVENPVKKVFYGRIPVENATALLHFKKKGMVQNLIHNLKYRGHKEVGVFLGRWLAAELRESGSYENIEVVIPVPLHRKKLRSRGFNQVEGCAREIAKSLGAEYLDDVLVKRSASKTQTLKKRLARWGVIEETFLVENQQKITNRHLLLVDDLLTTGATLEACAGKLLKFEAVKISIATMAITS